MTAIQIVSRMRPGTIRSASPIAIAEAEQDAGDDDRAELRRLDASNVSETDRSARPSRTSLTAWISAPCSQNVPTMLMNEGRSDAEPAEEAGEQDPERGEDDEHDDGDREEVPPVRLVELPGLAEHAAQGIHAAGA